MLRTREQVDFSNGRYVCGATQNGLPTACIARYQALESPAVQTELDLAPETW